MKQEPLPHEMLLQAIMRGKDLPIDPLATEEWGFSFWPRKDLPKAQLGYCWEYERLREDKYFCQRIALYRAKFKSEVERIQQEHPEWSRSLCEGIYSLIGTGSVWLLRDFPEFPTVPWLQILPEERKRRLAGKEYNDGSKPSRLEDTVENLKVFTDIRGQPLEKEKASGLALEQAVEAARRRHELEAKSPTRYLNHRVEDILPGTFVSWHVIKIEWKYRNKQLVDQFKKFLEDKEPEGRKFRVERTRGGVSFLERLKWLGTFRLLRYCKGNWKLAAQMSEAISPNGKSLYSNEAAWWRAAKKIEETLDLAPGPGEYNPVR